jgi:UDP-glucuronate 4-epimerase
MKKKYILITGAAGFIGFHLCEKLLKLKNKIIGIDNLNSYYDVNLKKDRLKILKKYKQFKFYKFDLQNFKKLDRVFKKYKPNKVINLAAQAGVRYSLKNSKLYFNSNIKGFYNIIELSKIYKIKHFIFSSSSSVYGLNNKYPFSEDDSTNHPSNFYSATKKCNEIIAHSYAHLFSLPCTGLRYFTVYGPWGRPDMSLFSFTRSILNKVKIKIFNYGKMSRDFTYIDDAIKYTLKLINKIPKNNNNFKNYLLEKSNSSAPWVIYNIGNNKPIKIIKK